MGIGLSMYKLENNNNLNNYRQFYRISEFLYKWEVQADSYMFQIYNPCTSWTYNDRNNNHCCRIAIYKDNLNLIYIFWSNNNQGSFIQAGIKLVG